MMPAAVTQYVLKVHSRCDLACDHCYVYEHADQSWRSKPLTMHQRTAARAALRIAEHAVTHRLPEVGIVLHGGEPLLLGRARMRALLTELRSRIGAVTRIDLRIQSNGVLLDDRWCAIFDEFAVKVGISLDGDRAANDLHRRYASGRSSHRQASRALALLRRPDFRHLYAGILCTIDVRNDPVTVYEALLAERPPSLDLLLPHATWADPPYRPAGSASPYASWLTRIYQRWTADGRPVPIRLFDSLISAARGGPSWTEAVGLDPVDLLVIETDGSYEQADSLKTAYDGAPATGMDVFGHAVDEVAGQPSLAARRGGLAVLSPTCQACEVATICGGGLYAHRYRADNAFDNPSVYCADLKALAGHVLADRPRGARSAHVEPEPPSESLAGSRKRHSLGEDSLAALAAGPGDVAGIRALAQVRLSLTRAAVMAVATDDAPWTSGELRDAAGEGWRLLCEIDADHRAAASEVLSHPYTYAWAVRCLCPARQHDSDLDRAHLAGLAAAAALRAGLAVRLRVPVRDGLMHLPGIGALQVGAGTARTAALSVSPDGLTVPGGGRWHATRSFGARGVRVTLEDLDPFRDCQGWPAAGRLTTAQWRAWRQALGACVPRLRADLPGYAEVLGAGLRSVVPLRPAADSDRSATTRHAFGAVAVALPARPAALDELLLHEFQHVKLHVLADLQDLFDTEDARRLKVPWRPDARPVEGVLHGLYAHLALTHLARSRGPAQRGQYLRYQTWVCDVAADLAATGALTPPGERFVAGMHAAALGTSDA
jgi:uncharacterized protein